MAKKLYAANYEAYFCNPETGESGWDIKFPTVLYEYDRGEGERTEANVNDERAVRKSILNEIPHFDCVILFNYCINMTDTKGIDEEREAWVAGKKYLFPTKIYN